MSICSPVCVSNKRSSYGLAEIADEVVGIGRAPVEIKRQRREVTTTLNTTLEVYHGRAVVSERVFDLS